eukprot:CAMPEP_0114118192 /NCGR_PEP_ID=MMETSP0043_2-20121206/5452_1 /TAXON_ID=464988 /ORGANISM="Hemiselmis andersenii, Strain CCMP644" /LENGTH=119 /DNA_ID=CAMNT_0001210667 /DNA_START=113 /DNA_END=472 /DNA_ORIENTATION=+
MNPYGQHYAQHDQALQNVEDMLQHLTFATGSEAVSHQQQASVCAHGGGQWGGQDMCMDLATTPCATHLAEAVAEYAHVYYSSEWSGGSEADEHDDGTGAAFHAQMQWCMQNNLEVSPGI